MMAGMYLSALSALSALTQLVLVAAAAQAAAPDAALAPAPAPAVTPAPTVTPAPAAPAPAVIPDPAPASRDGYGVLIQPFISVADASLSLKPPAGHPVEVMPNAPSRAGAKLGWRDYSLSLSVHNGVSRDEAVYGHTSVFDLGLAHTFDVGGRELLVSTFLDHTRGFFTEVNTLREVRPDLSMTMLGATATYFLKSACSFSAALLEYQPRAQSCGSWAVRASLGANRWGSDERAILPAAAQANFASLALAKRMTMSYLGMSAGYAYDWVLWRRFYVDGVFLLGPNLASVSTEKVTGDDDSRTSVDVSAQLSFAFGYAGPHFHSGLHVVVDLEGANLDDMDASIYRGTGIAFAGVRF
jgi:hypothetical protein